LIASWCVWAKCILRIAWIGPPACGVDRANYRKMYQPRRQRPAGCTDPSWSALHQRRRSHRRSFGCSQGTRRSSGSAAWLDPAWKLHGPDIVEWWIQYRETLKTISKCSARDVINPVLQKKRPSAAAALLALGQCLHCQNLARAPRHHTAEGWNLLRVNTYRAIPNRTIWNFNHSATDAGGS
jgi:hypothetical protein